MFQSNKLLPALGLAMSAAIVRAIPPPTTDLMSRDTSPSRTSQCLFFLNIVLTFCPAVIIQMFQWNWDSVAKECTEFIGPAGTYSRLLLTIMFIYDSLSCQAILTSKSPPPLNTLTVMRGTWTTRPSPTTSILAAITLTSSPTWSRRVTMLA